MVVQHPNLKRITQSFVKDFLAFKDFICKNQMVVEDLKKISNILITEDYTEVTL